MANVKYKNTTFWDGNWEETRSLNTKAYKMFHLHFMEQYEKVKAKWLTLVTALGIMN